MIPENIENLITKFLQGSASATEVQELHDWYQGKDISHIELEKLTRTEVEEGGAKIRQGLEQYIKQEKGKRIAFASWMKAAAVALLLLSSLWWLRVRFFASDNGQVRLAAISKFQPGHKGAVLHLDDGRAIILDSASNGLIATQSGVQIVKDAEGLRYKGSSRQSSFNTISTEKGRIWSLALPDGTKVWLNAASSIRFPVNFTGNQRLVEVTGEAYFEVVHNAKMPFRVNVGNQIIEDLGTSFNINAYGDNQNVITTLIEGSLRIDSRQLNCVLKPGQQARIGKDNIICEVTQMGTVTAWKEGYFEFYNANLEQMLQQISRWYAFDVTYKSGLTKETFTGRFPKTLTLCKALEILRQTGINFTIETNKDNEPQNITVSP